MLLHESDGWANLTLLSIFAFFPPLLLLEVEAMSYWGSKRLTCQVRLRPFLIHTYVL